MILMSPFELEQLYVSTNFFSN